MAKTTRSRRCRLFCPTDRLPCKLPLAAVVVEIKSRENQPFVDFYPDVKKIPTEWPVSKMQPRAHDPKAKFGTAGSGRTKSMKRTFNAGVQRRAACGASAATNR
jgi:hypothetical protein